MGQVRDTLAGPASPITKITEIRDQIYDLIQVKQADLKNEGPAMVARNQKSIEHLREAIDGLNKAEVALKTY